MLVLDRIIRITLVACLGWSMAEIGLTAWLVAIVHQPIEVVSFGTTTQNPYYFTPQVPSPIAFLLFSSIWSTIACTVLIATPHVKFLQANEKTVAIRTFVIIALTELFWLSAFGAYASMFGGNLNYQYGVSGVLVAFVILPWLAFLGLLVLNFLTAFGVLRSERPGFTPMFKKMQQEQHRYADDNVTAAPDVTQIHVSQVDKA